MYSDKVRQQEFARQVLENHIRKERLAHTYLLTGRQDAGAFDLAMAFACALNSSDLEPFEDSGSVSSKKICKGTHPDVLVIGQDPKARSIKIEEVKGILTKAALKPYEGKWKVYIFNNAERLTPDAANALLKTLEEPPARTIFVLIAESKAHLLETIQSRAFEVRLKPLALGTDETSPEELADLGRKDWDVFFEGYEKISREDLKKLLDQVMYWLRDEILRTSGQTSHSERSLASYLKAIDYVAETKEAVRANANQKLALSRLTMQLKRIVPVQKVAL